MSEHGAGSVDITSVCHYPVRMFVQSDLFVCQ